jgi:hypothetical protein
MSTFGARDLALLLPDNIGEAQNFKTSDQLKAEGDKNYEAPKPKIDASKKTRRYFPGKTPDWIPDENEEITMTVDGSAGVAAASDSTPPVDRRLARLQQKNENSGRRRQRYEAEVVDDGDDEEEKPRRRGNRYEVVQEGTVLEGDSTLLQELEEQAEEEDENARRARIKAKLLAAAALEEEERAATGRGQSAEDEEGSSEYETDTDSDDSSSEEETGRYNKNTIFAIVMTTVYLPLHVFWIIFQCDRPRDAQACVYPSLTPRNYSRERRKRHQDSSIEGAVYATERGEACEYTYYVPIVFI